MVSVLERAAIGPTPATLDAHRLDLSRSLLSIICRSTGRRRTPEECARMHELIDEIDRVRHDLRNARGTR